MFPLLRVFVVAFLAVGLRMPAGAQPLRARVSLTPQNSPQSRAATPTLRARVRTPSAHPSAQRRGGPVRRTRPPIAGGPGGVVFPDSNGLTTREVYLWRQPAKIEPHLRDVPRDRPVRVVGSQRDFYAVIMHDGLRGWMPRDAVRPR